MQIDPGIETVICLALAALFVASAMHKARDFSGFTAVVSNYRIAPRELAPSLALAALAAEFAVAFGLLVPFVQRGAAFGAAMIFAAYGAAIAYNLARGRTDIDCGCSFGPSADRITPALVVRNAVLSLCALAAALIPATARQLGAVDFIFVALAVLTLAALYLATERLRVNFIRFQLAGHVE